MKMKRFLVFLLVVMLATWAFAKVKIRVLNWSQELKGFVEEVAKEFYKTHPDIEIVWESVVQSQYDQVLSLGFRSGDTPDIFFHSTIVPAEIVSRGWVEPLEGWISKEHFSKFPSVYFAEGINRIDGKIYALPAKGDFRIVRRGWMYYNPEVLKKAGLDPEEDIPRTWSEFLKVAKKINEAGKGKFYAMVIPGTKSSDIARTFRGLTANLGMMEPFIDWRKGEYAFDSPLWLMFYKEFLLPLVENVVPSGWSSLDKNLARQMFVQGNTAFYFDGVWMPGVFKKIAPEDFEYGVAYSPVPDEGRWGYYPLDPTTVPCWYLSSKSKHKKEAAEVLMFLTSEYFQSEMVKRGYDYSPLSTVNNYKLVENPALKKIIEISTEVGKISPIPQYKNPYAGLVPYSKKFGAIHPNVWEIIAEALVEKWSPDMFREKLFEYKEKADQSLEEAIEEAKAKGYKVSKEDFVFPNWTPLSANWTP